MEVEDKHLNYLPVDISDVNLDKFCLNSQPYVVICVGFTSKVREFLPNYVNQVVQYVKRKGYRIVFLGKKETSTGSGHVIRGIFKNEIDYTAGLDLLDQTSLAEAQKIMSEAKCVIGTDSGLIHLAATSDVPIVCSFTTVKPMHREPYRNDIRGFNFHSVEPPESLGCRGCQSNMQFTHKHDFTTCYYVENKEDTEIQCVKQVTPIMYINKLEGIL